MFLVCYKPSLLKQNLAPIFEKKRKLGFKEIWKLHPNVVFSLLGSFFFSVVTPLDLEKLDTLGPSGSESFFQNTDGYFKVCKVIVDLYGLVINVLENFGLLRNF